MIATGLLHNLIGLLMGWDVLTEMHQEGWFATTVANGSMLFDREAIVWFLTCGCLFVLLGVMMRYLGKHAISVPPVLAPSLFILGLVLVLIMPLSGAYLLILLSVLPSLKSRLNRSLSHV
ncbi:DUF6463 family protein [Pseudoalteromonas sp. OOF1S-7]|nr:DUF6463 family protein [Pseudoalteromonas sp. OOF1S-7]